MSALRDRTYQHLSRKELQSLCKRYGLPANRSNSEMENSLIAYSQVGSGNLTNPKQTSCVQYRGQTSKEGSKGKVSPILKSFHGLSSPAGDNRTENIVQIQCGDKSSGACTSKDVFAVTVETIQKAPLPTFEFHVMSEEGINLFVDLSSKPDWSNELNNEVSALTDSLNYRSRSLQQELGCIKENSSKQTISSCLAGIDACQVKDGHVQTGSPSAALGNNLVEIRPSGGEQLIRSSSTIPCDADGYTFKQVEDHHAAASSKPDSFGNNDIMLSAEFFPYSGRRVPNGSDASDTSLMKSVCNSSVDTTWNGQKRPVPSQNSYHSNDVSEHSVPGHRNPQGNPSAPGYSTSSSVELHSSEFANCRQDASRASCNNGTCLGIEDSKCCMKHETVGIPESNEQSPEIDLLACAVESEKSNTINGKESPESSQQENSDQLIDLKSSDIESNGESPRKRQHVDIQNQNGTKPNPKLHKSSPQPTQDIGPRRSMRLVSK